MPVVVQLNCPYAWTILCAGIYTDEQWQLWKPNVGVYRDQLLNWDPYYQAQHQRSMFAFGLDANDRHVLMDRNLELMRTAWLHGFLVNLILPSVSWPGRVSPKRR